MSWEKPTASSLERCNECPTSCAIPIRVSSTDDAAKRGSALHGFVEAVVAGHHAWTEAIAIVPAEWRETASRLDWDALLDGYDRTTLQMESAYAIDAATGKVRLLGRSLDRHYPATAATEIVGTSDIDGMGLDGVPTCSDLKTGQLTTWCKENWQMRFHAYVQHKLHNAAEVRARLTYVREDGSIFHDEHLFEACDFADFLDDLRNVIARIEAAANDVHRGVVKVSEGSHCAYCPAYQSCPAKTAMLRQLVPDLEGIDAAIATLTVEQAAIVWEKFKNLEPLVKRLSSALKEYARTHVVTLSNGQVLTEIEKGRTSINGERALALARELGARDEDLASCVRQSTWTQIVATGSKTKKEKAA